MPIYDYAELITQKPVRRFLQKFYLSDREFEALIIVSPWIGTLEGIRYTLARVLGIVTERGLSTYVITREPQDPWHKQAVDELLGCNWVELRYNNLGLLDFCLFSRNTTYSSSMTRKTHNMWMLQKRAKIDNNMENGQSRSLNTGVFRLGRETFGEQRINLPLSDYAHLEGCSICDSLPFSLSSKKTQKT